MNPIKKFRNKKDLTRQEMALILDIPYSTLSEMENLTTRSPDRIISRLAEEFQEVNFDEMKNRYLDFRQKQREALLQKNSAIETQ